MSTSDMNNKIKKKKKKRSFSLSRLTGKALIYTLIIIQSIIVLIPVVWIVGSSLNAGNSLYGSSLLPQDPTFKHYIELFTETDFPIWYVNTLKIATLNTIFSVLIITMTSYVFSRFRFRGRKQGLMAMLILQMFPTFLTMTALFVLLWQIGLLNSHIGLVLVYVGGAIPYNAWLVKGYFDGIPRSLDEAARIDGASNLTIFRKIILPLAKPIITFVALTSFTGPWMDFLLPRLLIKSAEKKTLAVGLFEWVTGQQNTKFTLFAAGAILVAIPIIILFSYLQKNIVEGLSAGASKG